MAKFFPAGGGTYNLGSSISSTQTSILLSSFKEPVSLVPYTMALLNTDIAYGTIQPKTASSEFISFTGITQNSNGTALLTGVTRGLAKKYPFTSNVTFKLPHGGQSIFILSDVPQLFEKYISTVNDVSVSGIKTFTIGSLPILVDQPTTDFQAANKKYVDDVATFGAPPADTDTEGIVYLTKSTGRTNTVTSWSGSGSEEVNFHLGVRQQTKGLISMWIKPDGTGTGSAVLAALSLDSNRCQPFIHQDGTPQFQVQFIGATGYPQATKYTNLFDLTVDEWNHVVFSWTATSYSIYIDGALQETQSVVNPALTDVYSQFGGNGEASTFKGQMAECMIFSDPANVDITGLFNGVFQTTDIINYYPMDEGTGSTITDYTGNGFSGTFTGTVTWVSDSPFATYGPSAEPWNAPILPLVSQGDALTGTSGFPSFYNKYVTENDTSNGVVKTASTISFDRKTQEIRDSGSGFVTAGFRTGDSVTVSGSASNNGTFQIVSVATGIIVVTGNLVDEVAGASDTLTTPTISKVVRYSASSQIKVPLTPVLSTDATSKSYVDTSISTVGFTASKNGTTTYDLSTASGVQNIAHGLGKAPKALTLLGSIQSGFTFFHTSQGFSNGTLNSCFYQYTETSAAQFSVLTQDTASNVAVLWVSSSGTARQVATATFDATNIILTWVKTGSPTGTAKLVWEVEG